MVTIVKSDGTTERVSLVELKARQVATVKTGNVVNQNSAPIVAPPAKVTPPVVESPKVAITPKPVVPPPSPVSVENTKPSVATTTTVQPSVKPALVNKLPDLKVFLPSTPPPVKINTATAPIKKTDFTSPFEDLPSATGVAKTSVNRLDQVDKIIGSLSFGVPAQFANRLRSLIQLRIKDIRSEEDTIELSSKSIKDGGLGITAKQAEELISKISDFMNKSSKNKTKVATVAKPMGGLPMVEPVLEPAISTPFNSFVHSSSGDKAALVPVKVKNNQAAVEQIINKSNDVFSAAAPAVGQKQFSKPLMNDIISPPKSMGPLDEIKYFTLTDFRRLSDNANEAASRLQQKFINLKDESILLYFEAVKNWHVSPLFADYMKVVAEAIGKKQKLINVIGDKSKIQMPEIKAIVEMEKKLEQI